jgi:hypothetical protein
MTPEMRTFILRGWKQQEAAALTKDGAPSNSQVSSTVSFGI